MRKSVVSLVILLILSTNFKQCGLKQAIQVSGNVKAQSAIKEDCNKKKSDVVFDKEVKVLENLIPLYYKNDEYIVAKDADFNDRSLYKVNLENETKEKINIGVKITTIVGVHENGDIYFTDDKCIYSMDKSSFKVKKILCDQEIVSEIKKGLSSSVEIPSKGYVGYYKEYGKTVAYELLNLNTNKQFEFKIENEKVGKFLMVCEPYIYFKGENDIKRFDLESSNLSRLKTNKYPFKMITSKDGNSIVEGFNEDEWKGEVYKIDFENNKQIKYEEVTEGPNGEYDFELNKIDSKNNVVYYERTPKGGGAPRNLFIGTIEGDKIKIKNRVFKSKEDDKNVWTKITDCIKSENKVIVTLRDEGGSEQKGNSEIESKFKNYIFELK